MDDLASILYSLEPGAKIRLVLHSRAHDLAGQRFGRLLVLVPTTIRRNGGNVVWLCQCDCENYTLAQSNNLLGGGVQSCGCLQRQCTSERSKLASGEAAFRILLRGYKTSAVQRGFKWDLTNEEFRKLTKMPCWYCGAEPTRRVRSLQRTTGDYVANGIDRVDNARGYTPDNVVPCCARCNYAKGSMGYDEFLEWATSIRGPRETEISY